MNLALQILAGDKDIISYRKELNHITKSVTATILLQQLIYRYSNNDYKPFYKFIEPCEHQLYVTKDSWTEELGFTKYEFRSAYQKLSDLGIVSRKTNMNRVTFYQLDLSVLSKLIKATYGSGESPLMEVDKSDLVPIAETTTKTTTKSIVEKPSKTTLFEDFIISLKESFRANKIFTFFSKVNSTKATKDAFAALGDVQKIEAIGAFSAYVLRNKNMASRLDKFLVAYLENNVNALEYVKFDKPTNKEPEKGSIGWLAQREENESTEYIVDYEDA